MCLGFQPPLAMPLTGITLEPLSAGTSQSQLRKQQSAHWPADTRCPQPQGKHPLTSLLRQAFRCRGLLDMKNCQVVSAQGLGPGFSGANCTLRISRRAEFLGKSRGQHGDTWCLAEAGVLHSHMLRPKNPLTRWGKAEQPTRVHHWTTHPL